MLLVFCKFPKVVLPSLLALILAVEASAGFSSIYTFGDGVCTTTDSPTPSNLYSGGRYCNGPVWIEKISTLQGVTYSAAKNKSLFGYDSVALNTNVNNFTAPADAATSLFIVWSNDADFVGFANDNSLWQSSSLSTWTNTKIPTAINNLTTAINTLYAKGARKIVMPNAVNISAIPAYSGRTTTEKSFFRARVMDYNTQFLTATTNLMNTKSGLVIYRPNVFSYFEQVIASPGSYGFTNATTAAIGSPLYETSFTGPGANYVFWDYWHPTTKFQDKLATYVNGFIPAPDTTPPVLTLPGNLVREATGPGGAVVTFSTTAWDAVSGNRTTTNNPPSGSTFPLGQTTVYVSATDAAGNTAYGNFKITVSDTTPPVLTLPSNLVVATTESGGTTVSYDISATDLASEVVILTPPPPPPSGNIFPVGTTTVNVSATDAANNTSNGSFTVTVVNMTSLLQNVSITPAGTGFPGIAGQIQGGPPNGQVILQASADLGNSDPWRDIQTIDLDASGNQSFGPVPDPQGQGVIRNFFRIKLPQGP